MSEQGPYITSEPFEIDPLLREQKYVEYGTNQPGNVTPLRAYVDEELGSHGRSNLKPEITRRFLDELNRVAPHGVEVTDEAVFIQVPLRPHHEYIAEKLRDVEKGVEEIEAQVQEES